MLIFSIVDNLLFIVLSIHISKLFMTTFILNRVNSIIIYEYQYRIQIWKRLININVSNSTIIVNNIYLYKQ